LMILWDCGQFCGEIWAVLWGNLGSFVGKSGQLIVSEYCLKYGIFWESMQVKCIAKYGEQFCSSMLSVCSSMLSIPWKNDSVQRLPPGIVGCAQTTDPVVQCRAKYSESFCNRLGAACSKVTGTDIPAFSRGGGEYRLPEAISQCIAQENIVAMCYASKCSQQCDGWRVTCNINGGMAQLAPEQVTCFEKR
uniref:Microneme protein n=1 Tax=Anisakis simplex TaxID=6269 RepID=A0A0M3JCL6_ANISI